MGVSTIPGAMAFTRIPWDAYSGHRLLGQCRCDRDDLTAASLPHVAYGRLRHIKEPGKISGDDAKKVFGSIFDKRLRYEDARIVDEHVNAAESSHGALDEVPGSG
jgi:hypothetical protein